MQRQTDIQLVALARQGDREAFGHLIERYYGMSLRIAMKMVSNKETAQELVQEALLQMYLSLDTLREDSAFKSWLHGIVLNVCRNYIRGQNTGSLENFDGSFVSEGNLLIDPGPSPDRIVEAQEMHQKVLEAIEKLSPKVRKATLLFYYKEMNLQEVATTLGVAVGTVKAQLYKARENLRQELRPVYEDIYPDLNKKRRITMSTLKFVRSVRSMISQEQIRSQLNNCLLDAKFDRWESHYQKGKVRDMYLLDDKRILITTDRQSAFDHVLGAIPLKGQMLNRTAKYWFDQTTDIVPNQVIDVPDPNVTVARELDMLSVEIVVRRYLTGSTDTAVWTNYNNGVRKFCGVDLPDGMVKNQKFDEAIITPTTKADDHDESISAQEIVARGLVDADRWAEVEKVALALFARGTELAAQRGLILVDTKYEMGVDPEGKLTIADEIHTPDSSRYWILDSYEDRYARSEEPESLDKEFLRLWLVDKGISDDNIPELDDEIRTQVSERYIDLFERVTGDAFETEVDDKPIHERIEKNIEQYF